MNIRRIIFYLLLLLIILIPLIQWSIWQIKPSKPLNLLIIDKTAAEQQRPEHRSFTWILINKKYVKPNGSLYSIKDDYYGFFPGEGFDYEIRDFREFTYSQLDSIADTLDMMYVADSYGVYYNDWYLRDNLTEHSKLIYGGLTEKEFYLMREIYNERKLLITEFNAIAHPTNYRVRKNVEDMLGFTWTGWTGRYFHSLDSATNPELPRWVIRLYQEQNEGNWPFKRSGIVFVHENSTINILEDSTHLTWDIPMIITENDFCKEYGLPDETKYSFWFDIIVPDLNKNEIISKYRIDPNEEGLKLLRKHNLPYVFPAAIRDRYDQRSFYFAGDFCDNNIPSRLVKMAGINWYYKQFLDLEDIYNRQVFFWKYYHPMMTRILKDYEKEINP
ncbi:MAG: hypothetical protein KKA81_10425 [Bacteroidetes bacterium]|nr:hypothetical protein [Bacteroidota bacterium]